MTEQQRNEDSGADATGVAPESDQDIGTDPKHPHPQDRPVDDGDRASEDPSESNEPASPSQD